MRLGVAVAEHRIVGRHILRPLAAQRADKLAGVGEVVAAIMELHALAMPRQRHIGRMAVHPRRRQHMRLIDSHPLRFVDGGSIAMIDMGIVLEVERHRSAIVEPHRHAVGRHPLDLAQQTVLHAKPALVLEEHDAVAAGELPRAALGRHAHVVAQFARRAQPIARGQVQVTHLRIGMGEDDPGLVRIGAALRVPSVDQLGPGLLARVRRLHHAMRLIGMDGLAGPARRQRPRGVFLPVLMLPANLADLGRPMPLGQRAKRRARLDRLQLLRIADQHHLRARPLGRRQHPLHLARADHAGLVDHQHVART